MQFLNFIIILLLTGCSKNISVNNSFKENNAKQVSYLETAENKSVRNITKISEQTLKLPLIKDSSDLSKITPNTQSINKINNGQFDPNIEIGTDKHTVNAISDIQNSNALGYKKARQIYLLGNSHKYRSNSTSIPGNSFNNNLAQSLRKH